MSQGQSRKQDGDEQAAAARVDEAVRLLAAFEEVETERTREETLRRCVTLVEGLIEGCAAVSITVIDAAGQASTAESTVAWAVDLDREQYLLDDGPCLVAAREQSVQRIDYRAAKSRWPRFVDASSAANVASFLSAGFRLDDRQVASVNLYGRGLDAFGMMDESLTNLVTRYTRFALTSALEVGDAQRLAGQLERALHTRPVIDWAIGILMAQTPCGPDRAFDLLRTTSQRSNVKLRDVAAQVVERTAQRGEGLGRGSAEARGHFNRPVASELRRDDEERV
ncbi:MAG TPA: ANTAR domain-containing protein [Actinocrinis sp.]|nr:ANTAR domain-containing protein [Actinocrinis sp.]